MLASIRGPIYLNTASYASPTWTKLIMVGDYTVEDSWTEADVTCHASEVKLGHSTTRDISITSNLIWMPSNTQFAAIRTAYGSRAAVEILWADQPLDVAARIATRMICQVMRFTSPRTVDGVTRTEVTFRPCFNADFIGPQDFAFVS